MTAPITRRRALELAQNAIQRWMNEEYPHSYGYPNGDTDPYSLYAELAAALAYIENMARQKELL
jgi:hypothetical protein